MSDKEAIRAAFFALCEYQNPSLSKDKKRIALGRCWEILSNALHTEPTPSGRTNNWSYGEEKELAPYENR